MVAVGDWGKIVAAAILLYVLFNAWWFVDVMLDSVVFFRTLRHDAESYDSIRPLKLHAEYASKLPSQNFSDSAYVFLALGPQALQMNCPAAIESLHRIGGWKGDVYLITDRLDCFDRDEIVTDAEMDKEKLHIVSIDDDFGAGGYDMEHRNVGFRKQRLKSLTMKTKLFDYVDKRIQRVAYVDCDVLFSIEGCANDFMVAQDNSWDESAFGFTAVHRGNVTVHGHGKLAKTTVKDPIVGEFVYEDMYKGKRVDKIPAGNDIIYDIHAGSFVAHRTHSHDAMGLWEKQLERHREKGDNDAYIAAYYDQENTKQPGSMNPLQPHEIFYRLPDNDLKQPLIKYEMFFSRQNANNLACVYHISKSRCEKEGREYVQRFVNQYNLNSYKKRYPYCTHFMLQTFMYGWFPLNILPGCPKFEQIL